MKDTMPPLGQAVHRANIVNVTNSYPCSVEHDLEDGFDTFDFVRITDLNGMMPIPRGQDQINNYRYRIIVTSPFTFDLQDATTYEYIDSTGYTPYVSGGSVNRVPTNFYYRGDENDQEVT